MPSALLKSDTVEKGKKTGIFEHMDTVLYVHYNVHSSFAYNKEEGIHDIFM